MTVAEILRHPSRWCQGAYSRGEACCLSRAIETAYASEMVRRRIRQKVIDRIGPQWLGITFWNDDRNRTHAEVVALAKELGI
jgi:hypothetical protein